MAAKPKPIRPYHPPTCKTCGRKFPPPSVRYQEVIDALEPSLALQQEAMVVACLDCDARSLGVYEVARGSRHDCTVDPIIVLRPAVATCACRIVVGHGHISGDGHPSSEDVRFAHKLFCSCSAVDILLRDFLVVTTEGQLFSLAKDEPWLFFKQAGRAWPRLEKVMFAELASWRPGAQAKR